jgi:hypothetical protein
MGLKAVPKGKMGNGLRALSTPVRNKMGYAKRGREMMYPGGGSAPRRRMMGYRAGGGTRKKNLTSFQDLGEIQTELLEAGLDPNAVQVGMQNYQNTGDISTAINAGMGNGVPQINPQYTAFSQPGNNMMTPNYGPTMTGTNPNYNFMAPTYDAAIPRISNRFMRRAARKEGRDLMREMRQARRTDRREERQMRRADRRENRQERRLDRRQARQENKMGRINARSERQDARQMRRADRQQNRMDRRNARRMGY